jgi:autotransporter adhesin
MLCLGAQPAAAQFVCDSFNTGDADHATATTASSFACGPYATATSTNTVAVGSNATASGSFSSALGAGSSATGNFSAAYGYSSSATGFGSSAYGVGSTAGGGSSIAIGFSAVSSGAESTALGANTVAAGSSSIAIGGNSASGAGNAAYVDAAAVNGIAIGNAAQVGASGTNSVAIGSNSVANAANVVSVGAVGSERKIINVADGTIASGSTDAATAGQLYTANQRVAAAFGTVLDASGQLVAPSYSIQSQTYTNVGSAFGAVDAALTASNDSITALQTALGNGTIGLVQQSAANAPITVGAATGGTSVNFTGTAGTRVLTGVAAGTLSAASTDAVTGGQLYATNANVATNTSNIATTNLRMASALGGGAGVDSNGLLTAPSYNVLGASYSNVGGALGALSTQVTTNTGDIATLETQIGNGTVGLVQQDATTHAISIGATTGGTVINVAGTAGSRTITGVAAGTLSASSTDAVNGSQLYATNQQVASNTTAISQLSGNTSTNMSSVASALGGGATIDSNGLLTAPSYSVQGSTYDNVGGALGALDTQVNSNTASIASLTSTVAGLAVGNSPYMAVNSTGAAANASGTNAIALGAGATANGNDSLAMGTNASASGSNAIAIGTNSVSAANSIVIGPGATDNNFTNASVYGVNAQVGATGNVAIGDSANAASSQSVAVGQNAVVLASNGSAFGQGATVQAGATNSVAIGQGSIANAANTVSVGSAGNERRITNVAAGVNTTDAVNVGQLQSVVAGMNYQPQIDHLQSQINDTNKRVDNANAGVAMAMAMGGGGLPEKKKYALGVNYGTFAGQNAFALSSALRLSENLVASGAIGYGVDQGQVGGRVGLQVAW